MQVTLNWTNRNTNDLGTRIYRSTSPINLSSLPAPLATVAQGVLTYADTTAVRNTLYYYVLASYNANDVAYSALNVLAQSYTGPGPQTLLYGDYARGYFGELTSAAFITGPTLASNMGYSEGSPVTGGTITWLKFAYNGKILFIPRIPLRWGCTWNALYNAGLVFGNRSFTTSDLPPGNQTIVAQAKTVVIGGDTFYVRLMTGSNVAIGAAPVNTTDTVTGGQLYLLNDSSEYELLTGMMDYEPYDGSSKKMGSFLGSTFMCSDSSGICNVTLCQEKATANNVIARGGALATGVATFMMQGEYAGYTAAGGSTISGGSPLTNQYPAWRPVVELILV